jgi:hypothetical protein
MASINIIHYNLVQSLRLLHNIDFVEDQRLHYQTLAVEESRLLFW